MRYCGRYVQWSIVSVHLQLQEEDKSLCGLKLCNTILFFDEKPKREKGWMRDLCLFFVLTPRKNKRDLAFVTERVFFL